MNATVFLVDDHPMMRSGMRQAITQHPNLSVVGEASTGAAALKLAPALAPDVMVIDVHLPDMNGIQVARSVLDLLPAMKVIIFSADTARTLIDEALQAGACGYIWKQNASEELLRAIDMVIAGKLYLSPEVSAGILEDYRKTMAGASEPSKLVVTDREKQLLRLVAEGQRNKQIAEAMSVSPKSVEAYRSRLMKKLGCSSSAELVRYAIREGITSA